MYTTLVTRTTHISQQSAAQIHSYEKKLPFFLNLQDKCKASLIPFLPCLLQSSSPNTQLPDLKTEGCLQIKTKINN